VWAAVFGSIHFFIVFASPWSNSGVSEQLARLSTKWW
jgi:hypothetical protein